MQRVVAEVAALDRRDTGDVGLDGFVGDEAQAAGQSGHDIRNLGFAPHQQVETGAAPER